MVQRRGLEVRWATSDDLAGVLGVHAAHRGRPPTEPTAAERATWHEMVGTANLTVYLASLDGRTVGTASLLVMPNLGYDGAPTAFVEAVVVVPDLRRQGVATAIMRHVLADARHRGCDKVQLLSHKRHATDGAHDLYRSLGFAPEAEGFRLYLRSADPRSRP